MTPEPVLSLNAKLKTSYRMVTIKNLSANPNRTLLRRMMKEGVPGYHLKEMTGLLSSIQFLGAQVGAISKKKKKTGEKGQT